MEEEQQDKERRGGGGMKLDELVGGRKMKFCLFSILFGLQEVIVILHLVEVLVICSTH